MALASKEQLKNAIFYCKEKPDLLFDIFNSFQANNRITSRSRVYGIEFDITDSNPACTRIADAAKLKNDFVVGSTFQLNNGINDFDNVFPWCDIRLCNLSIVNGKKVITYQGDPAFKRDGSNGDVMVEIPKFYSMRERIGNIERWAITGEPKSGFNVEPAFFVGGKEVDFVYVGVYNTADTAAASTGAYSYTGTKPKSMRTLTNFIADYAAKGLYSYDFATFLMLQKLVTIEFGTRYVKQYLGGIGALNYGGVAATNTAAGSNIITASTSGHRLTNFRVGHQAGISPAGNIPPAITNYRTITNIVDNGNNTWTFTFDGSPLDITAGTSKIYGIYQINGRTDSIAYHTGRETGDNFTSAFKYRHMENIWGNIWERMAGLRIKELKYYYTFEPTKYSDLVIDDWDVISYAAPNQPYLGDDGQNRAWIVRMGYDVNDRIIALPDLVGNANGGLSTKFYDSCFYSQYDVTRTGAPLDTTLMYESVIGGAWDHYLCGGPFTLRMYVLPDNTEWLYGSRIIYR